MPTFSDRRTTEGIDGDKAVTVGVTTAGEVAVQTDGGAIVVLSHKGASEVLRNLRSMMSTAVGWDLGR